LKKKNHSLQVASGGVGAHCQPGGGHQPHSEPGQYGTVDGAPGWALLAERPVGLCNTQMKAIY